MQKISCSALVLLLVAACSADENPLAVKTPDHADVAAAAAKTGTAAVTVAAQPNITNITGSGDRFGVANGRWDGQPPRAPSAASNRFKGGLAADTYSYSSTSANPYTITLNGANFGTPWGTVSVTHRPAGPSMFKASIVSWNNTAITLWLTGPYAAETDNVRISITTKSGLTASIDDRITGIIRSRGAGQCTWECAFQRLSAGLAVPSTAYPLTKAINADYIPLQYDLLYVGASHCAIITGKPTKSVVGSTTTWTFTVTERNADWQENRTANTFSFAIQNGKIVQAVGTKGGTATSFWR